MLVALDSRKSSVMSLGRVSYDQRSLVSPVVGALPEGSPTGVHRLKTWTAPSLAGTVSVTFLGAQCQSRTW